MKSGFNYINIFFLYIIFYIGKVNSLINFNYPSAISLSNGNIFIVEKEGIYVYDGQLKNKIYSYIFKDVNDKINNQDDLSNVIIKSKGIYILCLINSKIFIFDYEGKYLNETEKVINDQNVLHPTLTIIPINKEGYYFYTIGYFLYEDNSYKMKLLYYNININYKTNHYLYNLTIDNNSIAKMIFWSESFSFQGKGLSWEYLYEQGEGKDIFLICFFIIQKGNSISLTQNYIRVSDSTLATNTNYESAFVNNINEVKQITSVANSSGKNALVCLRFINNNITCYKYHFIDGLVLDTIQFNIQILLILTAMIIYME